MAQYLIEEALLERLELEDLIAKALELEQHASNDAIARSQERLEKVREAQARTG